MKPKIILLALVALLIAAPALAQMPAQGLWHSTPGAEYELSMLLTLLDNGTAIVMIRSLHGTNAFVDTDPSDDIVFCPKVKERVTDQDDMVWLDTPVSRSWGTLYLDYILGEGESIGVFRTTAPVRLMIPTQLDSSIPSKP